jgi:hypothetical protein
MAEGGPGGGQGSMVVKEGRLFKRGEHIKNWRERYFILKEDGQVQIQIQKLLHMQILLVRSQ